MLLGLSQCRGFGLNLFKFRQGNVHEAIFLLKDIVDKAPQGADVRLAFARALVRGERNEEAKAQYGHYVQMSGISERELIKKIDRVNMDDILDLAHTLLDPDHTTIVSLGPSSAGLT